jgi:UDP-2-acetamido-3-amino-2,3-dideoxy-glucuronate N-acetyltransferase
MNFYKHPSSCVETNDIGSGSNIWQFCVILNGAVIGEECNICAHVFVENDVTVGDRVTIKSGVQLWNGLRVNDDVFIGPNVSFTNDRFPRSKKYASSPLVTILDEGCSIGAGSTILPGLTIGKFSLVGAGSVVLSNVAPYSLVVGNPARHIKFLKTG